MQQASFLYFSANPNLGAFGVCPTSLYVRTIRFPAFCQRLPSVGAYSHAVPALRGHAAVVVPMFHADHDRVGWSPWQGGFKERDTRHAILPFVWFFRRLKMQPLLSSSSTKRPLMWPIFLGQKQFVTAFNDPSRQDTHPKNWNYALKLKLDTPKLNWGKEDGIESLSWKFELNRTRNRFCKIKQSFHNSLSSPATQKLAIGYDVSALILGPSSGWISKKQQRLFKYWEKGTLTETLYIFEIKPYKELDARERNMSFKKTKFWKKISECTVVL